MSSGFVTEKEIEERRQKRQEEWEKVRTAEQPLEAPEEVYDHRSLFERLEEQRKKKDDEFEEAHKLKNMVRGLDDDEVDFLDTVERVKETVEKRTRLEERKEIDEFRNAVATLAEKSVEERLKSEIRNPAPLSKPASNRSSQMKLLAGAVVRKRSSNEPSPPPKKAHTDLKDSTNESQSAETKPDVKSDPEISENVSSTEPIIKPAGIILPSGLKCVGTLPGLGSYDDSSDSDNSSDSDCP
ncbi:PSME3-interacting protein isoform X2 [Thrips palmi]|uniref:PSME3-interacting protein isoform X2 n=1 Tax=Thrips palmi TaxID=161013 RepID=A0A6P9ABB4_THRPL|nr:PSME3-interacting protein isoform X2 [Thrips palmi]